MTSVTQKVLGTTDSQFEFYCEKCNYRTGDKSNYKKHVLTTRHKRVTDCDINTTESTKSTERVFPCIKCNKKYKSRNGLWCHSKLCSSIPERDISENPGSKPVFDTDFVMELIKQNKELQNLLVQQSNEKTEFINKLIEREPGNNNTINGNVTNNNHQKFNLNFFLNETCKDAMNIQEFLENIRVTFEDLLTIGDAGFVNGVSDILIKQLRDLDVNKRPIHCTDAKRETIYVKDQDAWNKDDKENTKLKDVIQKVEYKNVVALRDWCNENPDAKVNNTDNNILKDKIYMQTLQGDDRTRNRIIKNLTKEVIVEKGSDSEEGDH
jgi:hypothetical protein